LKIFINFSYDNSAKISKITLDFSKINSNLHINPKTMTDNQNPQTDEQLENTTELENSSTNSEENNTELNQEKPEKTEREMLIEQLQVEKKNVEEIAKKAQHDYIMLKYEFEGLINRTKNQEQDLKNTTLKDILKKFLPIVEQLIQSVTHIPAELLDNPRTQ
jgi:molecular chaperone GrpE (heat shock protein)